MDNEKEAYPSATSFSYKRIYCRVAEGVYCRKQDTEGFEKRDHVSKQGR
jgi:hypothetical protein